MLLLAGCGDLKRVKGSGNAKTESRSLTEFMFIQFEGRGKVVVNEGKESTIRLTIDDNLLPLISTDVNHSMLTIRGTSNYSSTLGLVAEVTTPQLWALAISGAGHLIASNINSTNLLLRITGTGKIQAKGTTQRLESKISGSGNIDAEELEARFAEITIIGAGNIRVHVSDELTVKIVGAGNVQYAGNPKSVRKTVTGAGVVKPISADPKLKPANIP